MSKTAVYRALLDKLAERDCHPALDWDGQGWVLDIPTADGELHVRVRSSQAPPDCFEELATKAIMALGKAGRA